MSELTLNANGSNYGAAFAGLEWSWKCELDGPDLTGVLEGGWTLCPVDPTKKNRVQELGACETPVPNTNCLN